MNIKIKDKLVIITPNNTPFDKFFQELNTKINNFSNQNIIVDLLNLKVKTEELSQFIKISEKKIELGTSFVLIYLDVDIDNIPDEIIIVPTYQEAIDMIEMDEMTRSLDF